jgi:hypothetical protein
MSDILQRGKTTALFAASDAATLWHLMPGGGAVNDIKSC